MLILKNCSSSQRKLGPTPETGAAVDTVLAVIAYWWIEVAFDTYVHLIVSVLVAPRVLLRSEESVKMGATLFENYRKDGGEPGRVVLVSMIVLAAGASAAVSWIVAMLWLADYTDRDLFWRSGGLGLFATNIGFAIAAGGAIAVAMLAGLGIVTGILIRALLIRVCATIAHLPMGIRKFSNNWATLTARTDIKTPPELIPGLPIDHVYRIEKLFKDFSTDDVWNRVFTCFGIPIFFLLSLLYRYSLKSTAWLYLPLIYIVRLPTKLSDAAEREI